MSQRTPFAARNVVVPRTRAKVANGGDVGVARSSTFIPIKIAGVAAVRAQGRHSADVPPGAVT